MKKVVTMLLCAAMLVGMFAVSAFAANENQFTITADKTEVNPGDEVVFTITVESTEACDQFGLIFNFDRDVFEFVKGSCNASLLNEDEEDLIAVKNFNKKEGQEGIAVSFLEAVVYSGNVGKMTLKVKDSADFTETEITARVSSNNKSDAVAAVINTAKISMIPEETQAPTTEATEPVHVHTWVDYAAVEPTCDLPGNVAYQQCSECGAAQTLEENPKPLSKDGWVLGPKHSVEHVAAVEPTAEAEGNVEYWYCTICGAAWLDEAQTQVTNLKSVILPKLEVHEHVWVEHEAVAPSCNAEGNIAYKACSECGEAWTLGENSMPLTKYGWVLGPTGEHTLEHHDAIAATCETDGHEAFDYCTTCECFFYEDALKLTYQDGIIPAAHAWVEYEAVEPTCDTEGNIAYMQCSVCGAAQTAGENPMPLAKYGWILGATGHEWVDYEAVAPGCNSEGNIAYQQCSNCGAAQTAGENPMPLAKYGWVLSPTGEHTLEHHDAVVATCDMDGHEAFDYCTTCECFFYEDPLKLTYQAGVIPALGHTWVDYEAVAPTCDTEGNIAYQQCSVCGAAQTAGENPLPLAKFGWILGATGHEWVEYAEKAPTCFEPGNIAYAQCSVCGAAKTLGENSIPLSKDGWILGVKHTEIKHVEAKAATTEAEGNVEYWYCVDCGYAWLDEARTQITNQKSVITPKLEAPKSETPATGDAMPVVALIVVAVMAVCGLALVVVNKKKFIA